MAKWLCTVTHSTSGQARITLPGALVCKRKWHDAKILLLEESKSGVTMRRFLDGESLKNEDPRNQSGSTG